MLLAWWRGFLDAPCAALCCLVVLNVALRDSSVVLCARLLCGMDSCKYLQRVVIQAVCGRLVAEISYAFLRIPEIYAFFTHSLTRFLSTGAGSQQFYAFTHFSVQTTLYMIYMYKCIIYIKYYFSL